MPEPQIDQRIVDSLLPAVQQGARDAGLDLRGALTVTSAREGVDGPRITVLVRVGPSGAVLPTAGPVAEPETSTLRVDLAYQTHGGQVVPQAYARQTAIGSLCVVRANRSGPDAATQEALIGGRAPHEYGNDPEYWDAYLSHHATTPADAVRMALAPLVGDGNALAAGVPVAPTKTMSGRGRVLFAGGLLGALLAGSAVGAAVADRDTAPVASIAGPIAATVTGGTAAEVATTTTEQGPPSTATTTLAPSTATSTAVSGCRLRTTMELLGIDEEPGRYQQGNILVTVRDGAGTTVGGVAVDIRTEKSDASSTTASGISTDDGTVIFGMRTTRPGENTLVVTDVHRDGCDWDLEGSLTTFSWQAS